MTAGNVLKAVIGGAALLLGGCFVIWGMFFQSNNALKIVAGLLIAGGFFWLWATSSKRLSR